MDDDVVVDVGAMLADRHDVHYVRSDLGPRTPDVDVVAYARAIGAVLVTSDRELVRAIKARRLVPCVYLLDLRELELPRVTELLPVIEAEYKQLGDSFFMQIGRELYLVRR